MIKKIILTALVFAVIGELLIRLDEGLGVMQESKVVKIEASVTNTPEYELVKENKVDTGNNTFRLMVIGDSYIHGGGIDFSKNVSQQLKQQLVEHNSSYKNIYVLDVTKPSSNNFDNVQTYFQFQKQFKPQMVILGYNYNDNQGNLDKKMESGSIDQFKERAASSSEKKSFMAKVYEIAYKSRLVYFLMHNFNDEMKAHGIVMGNSVFGQMLQDYTSNRANWIKSKELLQGMIDDAKANNIELVILRFPEMNLLKYPNLFSGADNAIEKFFKQDGSTVNFINGSDIFKGEKAEDNILSKYDGHPNEHAHKKMADYLFGVIKNENRGFSK